MMPPNRQPSSEIREYPGLPSQSLSPGPATLLLIVDRPGE